MTGITRRWGRRFGLWIAAALLLAGCGGGVGTGGTGDSPAEARGPIEGFGSVIVAGVAWNDDSATVVDENGTPVPRTGDELRLGMTVEIEGRDGDAPVAQTIRLDAAVVGEVGVVNAAGRALTVLGQNVRLDAGTAFDDSLAGGLADLRAGDTVVVHGIPEAAGGGVLATRIERAPAGASPRVRGVVSELDTGARTLRVGGLLLDYDGAGGVPAALANGLVVRIAVRPAAGGGWQVATFGRLDEVPEDGDEVRIDGLIANFIDAARFDVGGLRVDAGGAELRPTGAVLANGVRVQVRGEMVGGRLVAERVQVLGNSDAETREVRLNGRITSTNPGQGTFVVRKTVVDYRDAAFDGGTASDLAVGAMVRVEGRLSQGGSRVMATRVTFR